MAGGAQRAGGCERAMMDGRVKFDYPWVRECQTRYLKSPSVLVHQFCTSYAYVTNATKCLYAASTPPPPHPTHQTDFHVLYIHG